MRTLLLLTMLLMGSVSAGAQIALKPAGQSATTLRPKALTADVEIRGQFASTTLNFTFLNEVRFQTEAEFFFTLPPETAVTHFAYWFKDEKVVARVVEKARAAEIYGHITSRNRDPALIEMIDSRTFRARIFPVEANADLKVEIKLVQALPADSTGATFELPLQQEQALDSLAVRVRVHPDDLTVRVENNLGISVVTDESGYRFAIEGKNYRPQKDLRVRMFRTAQPLQASLYSARSGGVDGFFALALTPENPILNPTVSIRGVKSFDLSRRTADSAESSKSIVITGRYRGAGEARIVVSGEGRRPLEATVTFSDTEEPNNIAAKLWAFNRIQDLSPDRRNRSTVTALSIRHTIPSKYTSWLAVPKAEMERYRVEKAQLEADRTAGRLVAELERRGNTRHARGLRAELDRLCRIAKQDPQELIESYAGTYAWEAGRRLADLIAQGRDRGAEARRLRKRLSQTARHTNSTVTELLQESLENRLYTAASEYAVAAYGPRYLRPVNEASPLSDLLVDLKPRRSASARAAYARVQRVARALGRSPEDYIRPHEQYLRRNQSELLRGRIAIELRKPSPDQELIRKMEERFRSINAELRNPEFADARVERLRKSVELERLQLASADPGVLRRRDELTQRIEELRARMGDPLIQVEAPSDSQQVIALMPGGEVKRLQFNPDSRKWEARFDIPTYATEGAYEITVIIVRPDGSRHLSVIRYHVDITAPVASGLAGMTNSHTLRLELESDENTARVSALLPWGEKVELKRGAVKGRFLALAPIPGSYAGPVQQVTYFVTDRAHNRSTLTVDLAEGR